MLSKSLKIIHIDRNMSEFWWILCKSIILRVGHLLILLYDFVFQFTDVDNIKTGELTSIIKFLIMKPARCTDFSNFFLEWNSTCFGQFHCPSSGIFHCTHGSGICHTGLRTACEQDQDGTAFHPDPARKLSANLYDIYICCVYSEKLLMIDRGTVRNM